MDNRAAERVVVVFEIQGVQILVRGGWLRVAQGGWLMVMGGPETADWWCEVWKGGYMAAMDWFGQDVLLLHVVHEPLPVCSS